MFELVSIGMAQADLNTGAILRANAKLAAITGYSIQELLQLRFVDITHPDERGSNWSLFRKIATGEITGCSFEKRYVRKDGSIVVANVNLSGIRDASGALKYSIASIEDITERKRAEAQIQEQASLLDKAQDAIIVRDMQGRVTYWNKGSELITGWTAAEMIGRQIDAVLGVSDAFIQNTIERLLSEGQWMGEINVTTKSGAHATLLSRCTLMRDEKGHPKSILAINSDITLQKKLESQSLRNQRIEAMGTLSTGIAHDLNNILALILMATGVLNEGLTNEKDRELLELIAHSAQRGADVIRQLLTFSRGIEGQRTSIQLRHLIKEMGSIIRETFPRNICLVEHADHDLNPILADATQMHQVLMNLCVNARDAMPSGGELRLLAQNIFLPPGDRRLPSSIKPGSFVLLTVADTGVGIPSSLTDRIFEPFFTTKEPGKGTGLGLSTVLGIIRSHGGFVTVASKPAQGASFFVYLPSVPGNPTPDTPATSDSTTIGKGEIILLVDDEASVLTAEKTCLEKHGFRTLTAKNGEEALLLFLSQQKSVKLVVTDIMMPIMNGFALARALRGLDKHLRIIGTSGLEHEESDEEIRAGYIAEFIQKPMQKDTLLEAVQRNIAANTH